MITQIEIAERSGVSQSLVARALKNDPKIAEHTRRRIAAKARELGYRPNPLARALITGRTQTIALWIANSYTAYYTQVIRSVESQLKRSGFNMIVSDLGGMSGGQAEPALMQWPADGVLVVDAPWCADAFLQANPKRHIPLVSLGVFCSENTDFVRLDLFSPAVEAVQHLIHTGCQHIVHVTVATDDYRGEARRYGYTTAMQKAGLQPEFILTPDQQRTTARSAVRDYVREHGCPDGFFCQNDDLAIGAYRGLCDLGLRVPADVALVGCDGIEDTEYLECPLSTIVPPVDEMSAVAWQFLQRRIEKPALRPQRAELKATLVIRESSSRRSPQMKATEESQGIKPASSR